MATITGLVLSVNVGRARDFEYDGRPARSAIWKSPVAGRIAVRGVNLDGDEQSDRAAHGGPDKAIYSYAIEDLRWWEYKIGRPLPYGAFGEKPHDARNRSERCARRRTLEDRNYCS